METILLERPGHFRRIDTPKPAATPPGQALLQVRRVGICGTDIHAFRGTHPFIGYPRILGHELGVEIVEIGPNDRDLKPGDRCSVEPYLACGNCIACRQGKTNCCVRMEVFGVHIDGGMREFIHFPTHLLHKSERLSLEQLALVETLGIGGHAVDRAQLRPNEWVLVIGVGPIGLSVIQFAQLAGAKVIVIDVSESRLEFCRKQFQVEHAISARENPLKQIEERTSGDLATAVFDATGNLASMNQSFQYVASGGRLTFVGIFPGEIKFNDPEFHRREITLLASRNSTCADFKRIIKLIEDGKIDTTPWITHQTGLDNLIDKFPGWLKPEAALVKGMLNL